MFTLTFPTGPDHQGHQVRVQRPRHLHSPPPLLVPVRPAGVQVDAAGRQDERSHCE